MNRPPFRTAGGNMKPPEINVRPKLILMIGAAILLVILATTSVYTVQPDETAVVLTFGKYSRFETPGLKFKLPNPIESVVKVPTENQLNQEFGFRTVGMRGTQTQYQEVPDESLMLTGDLNVLDVSWITQFRIADPVEFLFRVRNIEETFRDMNESIMRTVVGDRSVNEVLTTGRQEIASEVEVQLQERCRQYEMGIEILRVVLQDVTPTDEVKPSFNEVNQAQQERERKINEALRVFNNEVPRAEGDAQRVIQEAEGYATNRVNRAQGDVAAFNALYEAYRRSPEVTRRRIYLETMERVLSKIDRKVILDDDLEGMLPLLQLGNKETP